MIVLHLHVHLTHVVATLADGLDGEFLQRHLTVHNLLQRLDGSIHRTISTGTCLKLLTSDVQAKTCHRLHTHTTCHLQIVHLDAVVLSTVSTSKHEYVVVVDVFLLVSQLQEFLIHLIELFLLQSHAQQLQTILQGCTSRTGSEYDGVVVDTHIVRVHNFVGLYILQHTILMNTTGMSKRILAHDGLVRLNRHVHQTRHHTACWINLCGVDISFNTYSLMALQNHRHLFQRRVSCTFTNTVDGHFRLTSAIQHTCHRVGCSHTKVVVAVSGENGLTCTQSIHMLHQVLNFLTVFVRKTIARGVWNVANRSTSFHNSIDDACQIFVVSTTCVLCIEFHILHVTLRIFHSSSGTLNDFLTCGIELILDVRIARTDTRMDALMLGIFQGIGSHVDVLLHGTCQGTNRWPCHCFRNLYHRIEIAWRRNWETGLDDIHTQHFQLLCHLYLLNSIQLAAWHLFTISQCGVENKQSF